MTALARIDRFLVALEELDDPSIFISLHAPDILRQAAIDLDRRSDSALPLRGMIFAVKDNIDVAGLPTTAGCPAYAYQPDRSASVVDALTSAGAIAVGKTNLDQFATGLVGTRTPHGVPRNPLDPEHVPGGSSSGSAVAVARDLVDFALGTDTAGSGRVPAAFCGIIGVKPTFGRLSTRGTVPAVQSADCISIFAPSIELSRVVLDVASGYDRDDPTARRPVHHSVSPTAELRVGVAGSTQLAACNTSETVIAAYEQSVSQLAAMGANTVEVDLDPFFEAGDMLYGGPWIAERTAAVGDFIREHPDDVDPTVAAIIEQGRRFDAIDAFRARDRLAELKRAAKEAFERIDVLVVPTVPRSASLAEVLDEPVEVNSSLGRFTTFANLLDLAALTVPTAFAPDSSIPDSITIYGEAWDDEQLLALAQSLTPEEQPREPVVEPAPSGWVQLAVAGAHLRGQPLESQLTDLDARFGRTTRTSPHYRLYALDGPTPHKPGLVHDPAGVAIEVDIWHVSHEALGMFLQLIPAPLALGKVDLEDGTQVTGFVCEPRALTGATDVSDYGGWRAYRQRRMSTTAEPTSDPT